MVHSRDLLHEAEQAQSTLLRCFADALGADMGAVIVRFGGAVSDFSAPSLRDLLGRSGDHYGNRIVTTWSRNGGHVPLSWIGGSLLSRGLRADQAIVEVGDDVLYRIGYGEQASDAVVAPIRLGRRPVGVLYASFAETPATHPAELGWIADSFAATAALCLIEQGSLTAALRASNFDGLTGCLSSNGVLDVLESEIARSQRHGHRLACCFVDLDGFKAVNDRHGHMEGNRVLAEAAAAIQSEARRYDSIGRFGGDEFVAVLPQTDLRGALRMAERMSASVAAGVRLPVQASIGVAEWADGMSPRRLVETADGALRAAKDLGTGQVVAAPSPSNGRGGLTRAGLERFTRRHGRDIAGNGHGLQESGRPAENGDGDFGVELRP